MKAKKFFAQTDDRVRVTVPVANRKRLCKKLNKNPNDFINSIIEFEIKSIRFRDGSVEKF